MEVTQRHDKMVKRFPSWLGKLLKSYRSGMVKTVFHDPGFAGSPAGLVIQSSDFGADNSMRPVYTDDGAGISPPLEWSGIPPHALSLILIVEDADSPTPMPFVHLLAWDIPVSRRLLEAGCLKSKSAGGDQTKLGRNGLGRCQYAPPDPLPGHGTHRYLFQLFAMDRLFNFSTPPNKAALKAAMRGHVVSRGCLTGTYERV
jgi:Raf kinase inhibitor-like YbhB/YbcL family protein